jgi:transglutaminase-like putative cysteine protease
MAAWYASDVVRSLFLLPAVLSHAWSTPARQDSVLNGPGDLPSSKPVFSSGTKHETKTSSEYQTLVKELCCTEFGNTVLHEITEFFQEDYDRFPFPTSDGTRTGGTCNAVACSEQSG